MSHGGRIRFFLQVEKQQRQFLESQLYAHYPDIEIHEVPFPFDDTALFQIQEAKLHHLSSDTLKLYVSMKDRTEKESIDPLSSLTSALAKTPKNEDAFLRVDFSPLADHTWREGTRSKVIESHLLPTFLKSFVLTHWIWFVVIFSPIIVLGQLIRLLVPQSYHE